MKKLNEYLSNLVIGQIKLHNLHWNLEGPLFIQVHEYLDVIYEETLKFTDLVAEIQKMYGHRPLSTIKEYLENATIKDFSQESFTDKEAIELTVEFVNEMIRTAELAREEANKSDLFPIANILEDQITSYLKHKWFLESTLEGYKKSI